MPPSYLGAFFAYMDLGKGRELGAEALYLEPSYYSVGTGLGGFSAGVKPAVTDKASDNSIL